MSEFDHLFPEPTKVELPEHIVKYFTKLGIEFQKDSQDENKFCYYGDYIEIEIDYSENDGWRMIIDSVEICPSRMFQSAGIPTDQRFDIMMACLGMNYLGQVSEEGVSPVCTIEELTPPNILLKVDGKEILFRGDNNVEYFEKHYQMLGYLIQKK